MYAKLHQKYGNIVRVLPNELSFNHVNAWRDIYSSREGKLLLTKDPSAVAPSQDGVYNVLSTPSVMDHARYRRILNPIFSKRALREQEPLITEYVGILMRQLRERCSQRSLDVGRWFSLVTFDIIVDLTFGTRLRGTETACFHPWVLGLSGSTMKFISFQRALKNFHHIKPLLGIFTPTSLIQQRTKHAAFVAAQTDREMALTKCRTSFMSHVLHSDPSNTSLSPSEMRENLGALVIAGSENVATTLDFTLYHLLKYPKAYAKARHEVRERFTRESDFNFSSVAELTYLSAVLTEAMRITPAAPSSQPRVVPSEGAVILGHTIPGGVRHISIF